MNPRSRFPFSASILLRMLADTILLQIAVILAFAIRLYFLIVFRDPANPLNLADVVASYADFYLHSFPGLTVICVIVFYLNGFYTYGRYYTGHYKTIVVTQAVSLAFLIYAFSSYFLLGEINIPRAALIFAWFLSVVFLVGARVWTQLWERFIRPERAAVRKTSPKNRRVLVIGGAGYIGSALVPRLLEQGHRVRLLDMFVFGEGSLDGVFDHPNLEIVRGDFRHVEKVVAAMQDVQSVIHLGAIVGDPACNLDESLTIDVNLSATRMIAELAKAAGVERFVFASTCSVYGACDEMLDERSVVKPISLYGHTKLVSEKILLAMQSEHFAPVIVRFATIYGLSGRTRFDLVVNLLAAKAKLDGEITVFGGDQWRPFVHVDDAANAVALALNAPVKLVAGEIFNVGSNEQNYTITQIGEIVQEMVISAKLHIDANDGDHRNYRVDFTKIHNLLGFKPNWTVRMGIEQVLEAIASGEVTDYRDVEYSNVGFLTRHGTTRLERDKWAREMIQSLQLQ